MTAIRAQDAATLTNVHPADELSSIREEIAQLESRERELRDQLLREGASLKGDRYLAVIQEQSRESVDKAALISAIGRERAEPFLKRSSFKVVKLSEVSG